MAPRLIVLALAIIQPPAGPFRALRDTSRSAQGFFRLGRRRPAHVHPGHRHEQRFAGGQHERAQDDRILVTGATGGVDNVILVVDGVARLEDHIITRLGKRFGGCGGPRCRAPDDVGRAFDQRPAEATRDD